MLLIGVLQGFNTLVFKKRKALIKTETENNDMKTLQTDRVMKNWNDRIKSLRDISKRKPLGRI